MTMSIDGPVVNLLDEAKSPKFWMSRFNRENPIIWMEMVEPFDISRDAHKICQGKRIKLYIDKETASSTLIVVPVWMASSPLRYALIGGASGNLGLDVRIGRSGSKVDPYGITARNLRLMSQLANEFNLRGSLTCCAKRLTEERLNLRICPRIERHILT